MQSHEKIREADELGAADGVGLELLRVIDPKSVLKQTLTFGRIAGPQSLKKRRQRSGVWISRRTCLHVSRKLQSDFFKDFQVAAGDGVAGAFKGVKRAVDHSHNATQSSFGIEESTAEQSSPDPANWMKDAILCCLED